MSGWLYVIKNKDLYKIGVTQNFKSRMRQLKPESVIAKVYTRNFKQLEKELHKRYREVRIPQTEYFRLNKIQIKEIKLIIKDLIYPSSVTYGIFINSFLILLFLFFIFLLFILLINNNLDYALFTSLIYMHKISIFISFSSLFVKSNRFFGILNECKFRFSRFIILYLFSLAFRFSSTFYFE